MTLIWVVIFDQKMEIGQNSKSLSPLPYHFFFSRNDIIFLMEHQRWLPCWTLEKVIVCCLLRYQNTQESLLFVENQKHGVQIRVLAVIGSGRNWIKQMYQSYGRCKWAYFYRSCTICNWKFTDESAEKKNCLLHDFSYMIFVM